MKTRMLLGTHVSVAGGVHAAFERGERIGCTTMQVFVKNSNQWEGKPLTPDDIGSYKTAAAKSTIMPVFAHAAYLINLCAKNLDVRAKSRRAFRDELTRCDALGVRGLIVHPGAHMGEGEETGIREIAASLNAVHDQTGGIAPLSILETTAGQGTAVGYRFEHLRDILALVRDRHRVAVCMDTAHLFAAGYDIGTEEGWEGTIEAFERIVGLRSLVAIHVNDSKKPLGSRVDRHEHIGKGLIGLTGFRMLMNDRRLAGVPKILETEKSDDMHEDVENMALLTSLVGAGGVP
jgi:deoxyribonuclease IV